MVLLTGPAGASTSTTTCRPAGLTTPPRTAMMMKQEEEDEAAGEVRRGPWTVDEDLTLINYITEHGDGRWNVLARAAGLKRTGKSCRLRWLNYLRPDVKRGDFTADEQLLILDPHSRWGNRWTKIAQQLTGRTDNEIKNYWRTRVQKHARQLNCDVNSRRFRDAMAYVWMPRLAEHAAASATDGQQHLSVLGVPGNNNRNSNGDAATAAPCLSALTTTTLPGCCCVVPSSSSSDSSLTSTESTAAAHEEKSVHCHQPHANGGADDFWTTTMKGGADYEFWSSTAAGLQEELNDVQDLTGWVQGFSDVDHNSLWSLDEIWRMQ